MLQYVNFDEKLKKQVMTIELNCEEICREIERKSQSLFLPFGLTLSVELLRTRKGKKASQDHIFSEGYESYVDIGYYRNEEYYPNGYIPIWKCKRDFFHIIGYLTRYDIHVIEKKIEYMLDEIYLEWTDEKIVHRK